MIASAGTLSRWSAPPYCVALIGLRRVVALIGPPKCCVDRLRHSDRLRRRWPAYLQARTNGLTAGRADGRPTTGLRQATPVVDQRQQIGESLDDRVRLSHSMSTLDLRDHAVRQEHRPHAGPAGAVDVVERAVADEDAALWPPRHVRRGRGRVRSHQPGRRPRRGSRYDARRGTFSAAARAAPTCSTRRRAPGGPRCATTPCHPRSSMRSRCRPSRRSPHQSPCLNIIQSGRELTLRQASARTRGGEVGGHSKAGESSRPKVMG